MSSFIKNILKFGEFPRLPILILYRSKNSRDFQYAYYIVRRIPEVHNTYIVCHGEFPKLSIRILYVTENFRGFQYAYCMSRRISEALNTHIICLGEFPEALATFCESLSKFIKLKIKLLESYFITIFKK